MEQNEGKHDYLFKSIYFNIENIKKEKQEKKGRNKERKEERKKEKRKKK